MLCMFFPPLFSSFMDTWIRTIAGSVSTGGLFWNVFFRTPAEGVHTQDMSVSEAKYSMSLARNGSQFGDQQSEKGYYFCVIILYDCGFSLIWFYFFISHPSQPPPPPLPQCNWHPANHFSSF